MSYPSFTAQRTRPVFSSRQQVLQYEQALALAGRVDAALEVRLCFESFCPWPLSFGFLFFCLFFVGRKQSFAVLHARPLSVAAVGVYCTTTGN